MSADGSRADRAVRWLRSAVQTRPHRAPLRDRDLPARARASPMRLLEVRTPPARERPTRKWRMRAGPRPRHGVAAWIPPEVVWARGKMPRVLRRWQGGATLDGGTRASAESSPVHRLRKRKG